MKHRLQFPITQFYICSLMLRWYTLCLLRALLANKRFVDVRNDTWKRRKRYINIKKNYSTFLSVLTGLVWPISNKNMQHYVYFSKLICNRMHIITNLKLRINPFAVHMPYNLTCLMKLNNSFLQMCSLYVKGSDE